MVVRRADSIDYEICQKEEKNVFLHTKKAHKSGGKLTAEYE